MSPFFVFGMKKWRINWKELLVDERRSRDRAGHAETKD
jgi:hypothetical protein